VEGVLFAGLQDDREAFGDVRIRHPFRSGEPLVGAEQVVVDRGCLTDRQQDVLETAHWMGYYEHPKEANATEVADELGITQTAFTGHRGAARRKLLNELLCD
jgi:predicted DNA binding protein